MKFLKVALVSGAFAVSLGAGAARADIVNFDEFDSPPVTCCFVDTGVTGPLAYTHVTIFDANTSGFVMNGEGWLNYQTSGQNLFGTHSGEIAFAFNTDVSQLRFDVINGIGASDFTVELFGLDFAPLGSHTISLGAFGGSEAVGSFVLAEAGIRSALISGNGDFAVDTISFSSGAPEPATWALMIGGFGLAGAALRRRRPLAA